MGHRCDRLLEHIPDAICDLWQRHWNECSTMKAKKEQRILCIAGWWPTGSNVSGIFIREHIQAIALRSRVVVVYAEVKKSNGLVPRISKISSEEEGLIVHRITIFTPIRRNGVAEWLVRRAYRDLIDGLNNEDPFALMHIHVRTEVTEQALAATAHIGMPAVVTEHNSFYHLGIKALPTTEAERQKKAIQRWFKNPRIAAIMPVSNDLSHVLERDFGVEPERISVIPNVAADVFRPANEPPAGPFRMMLAAVWRPPKDHDVFIRALGLLPPEVMRSCTVEWTGYGPDLATIKARCQQELPHWDIRFPGYVDKAQMAQAMQQAHIFVLPTKADNLPCVVLESLCCGTPVVSMAVNGVPELVDATNGILVPPREPNALADAILACSNGTVHFDRKSIAEKALARFSAASVSAQIEAVYLRVLRA